MWSCNARFGVPEVRPDEDVAMGEGQRSGRCGAITPSTSSSAGFLLRITFILHLSLSYPHAFLFTLLTLSPMSLLTSLFSMLLGHHFVHSSIIATAFPSLFFLQLFFQTTSAFLSQHFCECICFYRCLSAPVFPALLLHCFVAMYGILALPFLKCLALVLELCLVTP